MLGVVKRTAGHSLPTFELRKIRSKGWIPGTGYVNGSMSSKTKTVVTMDPPITAFAFHCTHTDTRTHMKKRDKSSSCTIREKIDASYLLGDGG
jgi:hypothetical protein